jgi:hypothetical protein
MPVISFGAPGERNTWLVSGWVYRGVLDHARGAVAGDGALELAIDKARALDGLHFHLTDERVARQLVAVLIGVADRVLAGDLLVRADGRLLDDRSQAQFRDAVGDLRTMLRRYGRRWQAG